MKRKTDFRVCLFPSNLFDKQAVCGKCSASKARGDQGVALVDLIRSAVRNGRCQADAQRNA